MQIEPISKITNEQKLELDFYNLIFQKSSTDQQEVRKPE